MQQENDEVSLGFIHEKVSMGTHMCLLYTKVERRDSLLRFLLSGLEGGERSICFSENMDEKTLKEFFLKNDISYDEQKNDKTNTLLGVREECFQNGVVIHSIKLFLL